jgi:hypothetical protein
MIKLIHHLLNPHCEHCAEEEREKRVCNSCEVLKMECARLQIENDKLLNRILEKPEPETRVEAHDYKPLIASKHLPWNARKQALEAESRNAAKRLREIEQSKISTDDLEKELDVATAAREN